jgi:tight adherence protein B
MEVLLLSTFSGGVFALGLWALMVRAYAQSPKRRVYQRLRELTQQHVSGDEPKVSVAGIAKISQTTSLSRRILQQSWGSALQVLLDQAGVNLSVGAYFLYHVCGAALGFMVGAMLSLHPGLIFGLMLLFAALPTFVIMRKRDKRFQRLTEQLPEAIRLITSSLRAGLGLDSGIEIVAKELPQPLRGEFQKLLNERRLYSDVNEAFRRMTKRLPLRDYRLFAASASLHREVGGNFAELLDQLERTIRNRFQLQRELRTLTAESRLSGLVLGVFPLVVAGGIIVLNPDYFQIMWEHRVGRFLLYAAFFWQLLGFIIIKVMTTPRFK